ncbi:MAG: hypothetical protein WDN04_21040 [Rhodospirillales bacterium]
MRTIAAWSSVAARAGALKAAARRCAVAPQSGGASLDRTCARSPWCLWPGRRNGAPTKPRNWWRRTACRAYRSRNGWSTGAIAQADLGQPQVFWFFFSKKNKKKCFFLKKEAKTFVSCSLFAAVSWSGRWRFSDAIALRPECAPLAFAPVSS